MTTTSELPDFDEKSHETRQFGVFTKLLWDYTRGQMITLHLLTEKRRTTADACAPSNCHYQIVDIF